MSAQNVEDPDVMFGASGPPYLQDHELTVELLVCLGWRDLPDPLAASSQPYRPSSPADAERPSRP